MLMVDLGTIDLIFSAYNQLSSIGPFNGKLCFYDFMTAMHYIRLSVLIACYPRLIGLCLCGGESAGLL